MNDVIRVNTSVPAAEVNKRRQEVARYERFATFIFRYESDEQREQAVPGALVQISAQDGVYLGHVVEQHQDQNHFYVNLK